MSGKVESFDSFGQATAYLHTPVPILWKEDEQAEAQDESGEANEQNEDGESSDTAHDKEKTEVEDVTPEQLTQRHEQFESLKASIMGQGDGNSQLVQAVVGFEHLQKQQAALASTLASLERAVSSVKR